MDREPERVEIELTPTDAPRQRREPPGGHVPSLPRPPSHLLATERSRLITTAVGVGTVALCLGWLVGRAGGANEVASDAATTTTTFASVSPVGSVPVIAGDTLPPVVITAPRPQRTTTTTLPPPPVSVTSVEIDARLIGSDIELVGGDSTGGIFELDVATGELTRTRVDASEFEPSTVTAGPSWVAYQAYGVQPNLTIIGPEGEHVVRSGADYFPAQLFGATSLWRPAEVVENGRPFQWEELDLTGEPTGNVVDVRTGWATAVDPLGGLVVQESGKIFRVAADGQITLLADGDLFGLDENTVVYRGCDELFDCSLRIRDRSTGESRPVTVTGVDETQIGSILGWGSTSLDWVIAPTDDAILVTSYGSIGPVLVVINLETGVATSLDSTASQQISGSWSPDGRWVFYLVGYRPMCFDRTSGEQFPVVRAGLDQWRSVVSRPVAP